MLAHGATPITDIRHAGLPSALLANSAHVIWYRASNVPGLPSLMGSRIVDQNVGNGLEKWFEVGIPVRNTDDMVGNASSGWTTLNAFFRLELSWSADMVTWALGKFSSSGTTSVTLDGVECTVYWARSMYPKDSALSTSHFSAISTAAYNGDARNNPITALTLNSTVQSLPHFPYTLPGDAATLQADLIAAGWTGAVVTATSNIDWEINIPGVTQTAYYKVNKVYWPLYLVADMFGAIVNPMDGVFFQGDSINSAGIPTKLPHQFARLALTPLKP